MGTYSPHPRTVKVISPFDFSDMGRLEVSWLGSPFAISLDGGMLILSSSSFVIFQERYTTIRWRKTCATRLQSYPTIRPAHGSARLYPDIKKNHPRASNTWL